MNILYWIIFGLIVGVIANFITPSPRGGILWTIILGIVGALVGGFIGRLVLGVGVDGFNLTSFLVAIGGALLVIFIGKKLMHMK